MRNSLPIPQWKFPRKTQCLFRKARYKVLHGGRGGAKSWAVARYLLKRAVTEEVRILCTRELQNSIKESVHQLLKDQIQDMGLSAYFQVTDATIKCALTGSFFIFAGLRTNVTKLKSMEGIDVVWVEEAEVVSEASWKKLIPTVRKAGSEILVTFNPDQESDPTYQRFIVKPPPHSIVQEINWQDNPWFPQVLRDEMEYDFSVDPEGAEHVWNGKLNMRSDAIIFAGRYVVQSFVPDTNTWGGPYYGQDFGFAQDPAATIKMWITPQWELAIEEEAYGLKMLNDELEEKVRGITGAAQNIIRADCSRPETIAHMRERGLNMVSCKKWQGCVEDGIQFLRSFKQIIIHPQCPRMVNEARMYRYKVDKLTGNVLPIIVDAWNHGWDGVRYGLEPLILQEREDVVNLGEDVQIDSTLNDFDFHEQIMGRGGF